MTDTFEQLTFNTALLIPAVGNTIQERFESFHAANGWVFRALEQLTADHVARGRLRVGIGMLFEVLRWHYGRTTSGGEFRLNNNYRSRYVRLLVEQHPEWVDVFELRELRAS